MKGKELKEYICNNDRVSDILESIGMHTLDNKGEYISCAYPGGDNPNGCLVYVPSLYIRSHTRKVENKHGFTPDIFDLISFIKGQDGLGYCSRFLGISSNRVGSVEKVNDGLDVFRRVSQRKKNKGLNKVYFDNSILAKYEDWVHIDVVKDGILPTVAKRWGMGFDIESNRYTFIHRCWSTGKILGVVGRTVIPAYKQLKIPKYYMLIGNGTYHKTNNLYGLWENMDTIKTIKKIIIVESEKSVIKLYQMGVKYAVSVGCHDLSDSQIAILTMLGLEEIIVAWDSDVETEHTYKTCEALLGVGYSVSYIDTYRSSILRDMKVSPADLGYKKFNALYKLKNEYKGDELSGRKGED